MASCLLLGLALAAFISAPVLGQTQKISLSQTSFSLTSGMVAQVQFKLAAPIICDNLLAECSVTVRITNMNDQIVALDTCLVKWMDSEWSAIRTVTISAKSGFVDDSQIQVMLITSPANSSAVYYSGFQPANITLQTEQRQSSQCVAWGDPHYTTFDGWTWNAYDYNTQSLIQHILYRSTAIGRTFMVQSRAWNPGPPHAMQCAIAALESNDLIIIDECSSTYGSATPILVPRITSPTQLAPRVTVTGITYEIFFQSGAYVRADAYGWGYNVYMTAPGQDFNKTVGMCGNNNGYGPDDVPCGGNGCATYSYSDLFPSQQMYGVQDLWSYFPNAANAATLPPYAELCTVLDTPYVPPVLNNPNGNDITGLLTGGGSTATVTLPPFVPATVGTPAPGSPTVAPAVSLSVATAMCNSTIMNSTLAQTCAPIYALANISHWADRYILGCALDVEAMGPDPSIIGAAMQGLQSDCAMVAQQQQQSVSHTFCPTVNSQPCSGHGTCSANNTCACTSPYAGSDCSISTLSPPVITSVPQSSCDVLGLQSCPGPNIAVSGSGFLNSPNLACRFNNTVWPGLYMGAHQVLCQFPQFQLTGFYQDLYLSVSNDATLWSNALPITYYNSKCVLCSGANSCLPNNNSCIIGGTCYANGDPNLSNPCQTCNIATSTSTWSYNYNHYVCGPSFAFNYYSFKVVGNVGAGYHLGSVIAGNAYVQGDSTNVIRYFVNSSFPVMPFGVIPDPNNPGGVIVVTTMAINTSSVNISRVPSSFLVYAQDSHGYVASATISVNFVSQSTAPQFNAPQYSVSIPDSAAVGTPLITVQATPGSVQGPLIYDWVVTDSHFALNSTSGQLSVAQPLNYWQQSLYVLQVRARDSSNQFSVVVVNINVTYVPRPPTAVILSSSTVDEKQTPGTVVANLTSIAPGSTSFTYTIYPPTVPFAVVGNQLVTTATLDYETGPITYTFNITTRSSSGLNYTQTITVTVNNVIEPPISVSVCPTAGCGAPFTVPDDTQTGEAIAYINYVAAEPNVPVTCVVYPSASFFTDLENGVYVVHLASQLNYLASLQAPEYVVANCSVINGHGVLVSTINQSLITVLDRPKAPAPVLLNVAPAYDVSGVPETAFNVVVGSLSSVNVDPTASNITFSIPSSDPLAQYFTLSPPVCTRNGTLSYPVYCSVNVILISPLDTVPGIIYGEGGVGDVTVTVRATDSASQKFVDSVVTVPVGFVNQPPLAPTWITSNSVTENSPINTTVGILQTNDVHPGLPQSVTVIGASNFGVVPLTASRRRSVATATEWEVIVTNSSFNFMTAQTISLTLSVTNYPPVGAPMTSTFTTSISVTPLPMSLSLVAANNNQVYASNTTVNVNEHTPANTVIGAIQVNNFDRPDLTYTLSLVSNAGGYFALQGNNLVRTHQNLDYNTVKSVVIEVNATFSKLPTASPQPWFVPISLGFFFLSVQQVVVPPALVFANGENIVDVSVPWDTLGVIGSTVTTFQVTNTQNQDLHVTISNDPQNLLIAEYSYNTDSWSVVLTRNPHDVLLTAGFYSDVEVQAVTSTGVTVTGTVAVNVTSPVLPPSLGGNQFGLASTSSSSSSASVTYIVVGVVIGAAVLTLLIIALVIRRRKTALVNMAAVNEPFYNTVADSGVTSTMHNPTYQKPSDGFEPGVSNPMYGWYRPDLSRQECEEMLVDQTDGAFVIRDSTATPGWHMLAVKTQSAIVHEKIKMNDDGLYELLPGSQISQPRFGGMSELVEYYSRQQAGVRYALSLDNPMYDNGQMASKRVGHAVSGAWSYQKDQDAPAVPLKERERAVMEQIVQSSEGEIYTNAEQAKTIMSSA